MRVKKTSSISLLVSLVLLLTLVPSLSSIAQGPETPAVPYRAEAGSHPPPGWHGDPGEPFTGRPPSTAAKPHATLPGDVPLGEPGLSFRYERTFGETLVPYLADNDHLFSPGGVATDAAGNVYVTERHGCRMLKFTAAGAFLISIGEAGVSLADNTGRLGNPVGLDIDGAGNIWIAEGANRASQWAPDGAYLGQLGTGNCEQDDSSLCWPEGMAIDSAGNLYVADTGNHRVQIFDAGGEYTASLGTSGTCGDASGELCAPTGLAVDGAGRIYVADSANRRVQIYDASLKHLATLGTTGTCGAANNQLCTPRSVEIGPAGKVYVADSANSRVQIFAAYPDLSYQATLGVSGEWGSDNAHFGWPNDVAVDNTGNIYVADENTNRVQMFDKDHSYVRTFGVTGVPYLTDNLHYEDPRDVAVDASGNVLIVEGLGQRVIKLNAQGVPQFAIGSPGNSGSGQDRFCFPDGISTDSSGAFYVADACNNRIQIYSSGGTYQATLGGERGTANNQFFDPRGVHVGADGQVYVADTLNHRVQVYDSSLSYVTTLGVTGEAGSDNQHFDRPEGVALDPEGHIYVADLNNQRVQKCILSGKCRTFAGVTGERGSDFGHLDGPYDVDVDKEGHVYVVDMHNTRVQVYDQNQAVGELGPYRTTISGRYGQRTGQSTNPRGIAVDHAGNVYVADTTNHRVQKYALGVPGWRQTNLHGFGDPGNWTINSLVPYGNHLYASTWHDGGGQLWRTGSQWEAVTTDGFGDTANNIISQLIDFKGKLYAGTSNSNGAEIWRSGDGQDWTQVVSRGFGDPERGEIAAFSAFKDMLYAAVYGPKGAEIWRSGSGDSGDWTRVVSDGFGDSFNLGVGTFEVFDGHLYAGTNKRGRSMEVYVGAEVWRTADGTKWTQVNADGFGVKENITIMSLTAFENYLYAGTRHGEFSASDGGQIWRCSSTSGCDKAGDWTQVLAGGFGTMENSAIGPLIVYEGTLYAMTENWLQGMEVWRSRDIADWQQVGVGGFGSSNTAQAVYDNSVAVHDGHLYVGTFTWPTGGQVWMLLSQAYLPLVTRNHK